MSQSGTAVATRVVAILTAYNRRQNTLACLRSFFDQDAPGLALSAVVVDDGSSDGTAAAVSASFDHVEVVPGSGDLYWAAGMALAESHAVRSEPDFLLWLNDDVELDRDGLRRLVEQARALAGEAPIVVSGGVRHPVTCETTYGGVCRRDWHPMRYRLVEPCSEPQLVDTVHGNVLLVPQRTYRMLTIDGGFAHAYADYDFGLRLRQRGGSCYLAAAHYGVCPPNDLVCRQLSPGIPLRERWKFMNSRKGLPLRSQVRYLRRHGGAWWPLFVLTPYLRLLWGTGHPDLTRTAGHPSPAL
jgi:GT2 family glycosyltransferase